MLHAFSQAGGGQTVLNASQVLGRQIHCSEGHAQATYIGLY